MKNKYLAHIAFGAFSLCLVCAGVQAQAIPDVNMNDEPVPVDFPQRTSLGEVKEAPLPSMVDSVIKDPSPMAVVVSRTASPSEQLLGRITSEVFYEMADIERANVFLKLQTQREQLKNDLEKLKAQYRQARLDEIEKREGIIRTRSEWMQEQERARQEIQEKRLQAELLEKQIEEAELRKEELITDRQKPATVSTQTVVTTTGEEVQVEMPAQVMQEASALATLTIMDIKGMKNKLAARVYGQDGRLLTLKVGDVLPSGHVVKSIGKRSITFEKNGIDERIEMAPPMVNVPVKEEPTEQQ